jgi:hypothetical protein
LGGGTYGGRLTNCIVYFNSCPFSGTNDSQGALYFCCTPSGTVTADPQLQSDGMHLASTSPCRGAGLGPAPGADLDNQPWGSPPSIGCDEWQSAPAIFNAPNSSTKGFPVNLSLSIPLIAGQGPFTCWWLKGGTLVQNGPHYTSADTTNVLVNGFGPADAGTYQLVASNGFGVATSQVMQVVVHCANAGGSTPVSPYSDWSSAATNLQDAVDAASLGEFVLATNGIYATGGRVVSADLTNRVALLRPVVLTSINGAGPTIIQGVWDPVSTNGPGAVRCAWLGDGATLAGFTLQRGATRNNGDLSLLQSGGGTWANSTNAWVLNCIITNCAANYAGGGAYQGTVNSSQLLGNFTSRYGAGAYQSTLLNSLISGNSAKRGVGGGAYSGTLINCTVSYNQDDGVHGEYGTISAPLFVRNSILFNNSNSILGLPTDVTGNAAFVSYSSTTLYPVGGVGNIVADPQLLDSFHIATTSPCRGAGSSLYSSGTDIDGEAWASPPSMGCAEVWDAALTGPLSVGLTVPATPPAARGFYPLWGSYTGRVSRVAWDFGDGSVLTNVSHVSYWHIWTNAGDYTLTFTAFNTDYPAGVSTNLVLHVVPLASPAISVGGLNGTSFSLSFASQYGVTYVVEETTNLAAPITWQGVATVYYANGSPQQVTDTKATNAARFYRVRVP